LNIYNYYITGCLRHQILQLSESGNVPVAETYRSKTNIVQIYGNKLTEFLISFSTVEQKRCSTDSSIIILPSRTIVLHIISKKLCLLRKDQVQLYS